MHFYTGIAVSELTDTDIVVAAATWFKNLPPNFATTKMGLAYMKKNLCSTVIVRNDNIVTAVNSACHRSVERLLIRDFASKDDRPEVYLLLRSTFQKLPYILPVERRKNHWLLNAAERAITAWHRGER